jgi:hypothetical protein
MKTSIQFKIIGKHETHSGIAEVFDFITSGYVAAQSHFNSTFKINSIGVFSIDGKNYSAFETYVDSANDDYYYFAIEIVN